MAFFENELKKMFGKGSPIKDARFVGSACVGRLSGTVNVKIKFAEFGRYQKYEGLEVKVFNRNEGVIDSNAFKFVDILGIRPGREGNHPGGVSPHVWVYREKTEWYGYQPTAADYAFIAIIVNKYLEVFLEPADLTREADKSAVGRSDGNASGSGSYSSVIDTIKADKAKPRQPCKNMVAGKGKNGGEL